MSERMTPTQEAGIGDALLAVWQERERQHAKWGVQRHDFPVWLTVLMEEVGELAQALLAFREIDAEFVNTFYLDARLGAEPGRRDRDRENLREPLAAMRAEAVQVAAVAVALVEHINERLEDLERDPE